MQHRPTSGKDPRRSKGKRKLLKKLLACTLRELQKYYF